MTLPFKIFFILFAVSFLLNMAWVFAMLNYCKTLKIRFPSIYHLLGDPPTSIQGVIGDRSIVTLSPSMGTMVSLTTAKAMIRSICFLLKKQYESLNDPALLKHSRLLRAYFFLVVLVMLSVFSMVGVIIYTQ
jgi:hypothetical protein